MHFVVVTVVIVVVVIIIIIIIIILKYKYEHTFWFLRVERSIIVSNMNKNRSHCLVVLCKCNTSKVIT
jgi:hypothetical protein